MVIAFLSSVIYIVFRDLREHRISNKSLLLLAIPLSLMAKQFSPYQSLGASAAVLFIALTTSIGGGDIKLLILLVWTSLPLLCSVKYLTIFLIIALAQLLLVHNKSQWRSAHIPMAPAILLPLAAIHLGI